MNANAETVEIQLPAHLSRAEKNTLRTLVAEQIAAGKPISAARIDALADYVAARARIRALTRSWRQAVRDRSEFISHKAHVLALARQLDATVKLSQRLAAELGIR